MTRTVLIYGDSNSHGSPPMHDFDGEPRFDRFTRWPGVMAGCLGTDWQVIEEGLPGRTTVHDDPVDGPHRNGLLILPAILHSHKPIDLIVLMLGTNDLKLAFAMTPIEIAGGIDKLLRLIAQSECGPQSAAPRVLLIAPPPVLEAGCLAEMFAGGASKSGHLAKHYAALATLRGALFLDAGQIIRSSPLDGVHFDAAEHGKLGRAVADAVNSITFQGEENA